MNSGLFRQQFSRIAPLKPRRRKQTGSLIVEMAIVSPVLILLTFSIVQYGMIMNASNSLTQISREAARFEAVHATEAWTNNDPSNATSNFSKYLANVAASTSVKYSDLTTTISYTDSKGNAITAGSPGTQDGTVTVTIQYNLHKQVFMPSSFPGVSKIGTVNRVSAMIIE